jgi:hypothetical protein
MSNKTTRLTKSRSARTAPPPKRTPLSLYLAGGAVLLVLVGIALLSGLGRGSSGSNGAPQVVGQPKLAVDREQIDFGRVPLNIPVRATFKLSNLGDQPLQILNQPVVEVKQGC